MHGKRAFDDWFIFYWYGCFSYCNGYIKIQNIYDIELQVHQCWDCNSEGEFVEYVTENDNNFVDDGVSVKLH